MNNKQLWAEANKLENTLWHKLQADFSNARLHHAYEKASFRQFRRYVRSMG
jgi:hypothetical protein